MQGLNLYTIIVLIALLIIALAMIPVSLKKYKQTIQGHYLKNMYGTSIVIRWNIAFWSLIPYVSAMVAITALASLIWLMLQV